MTKSKLWTKQENETQLWPKQNYMNKTKLRTKQRKTETTNKTSKVMNEAKTEERKDVGNIAFLALLAVVSFPVFFLRFLSKEFLHLWDKKIYAFEEKEKKEKEKKKKESLGHMSVRHRQSHVSLPSVSIFLHVRFKDS